MKILWQEAIRYATACKSLSHSAIRLNGSSEHRDTAVVQGEHVFTAGVAGIDHHLFGSFAQALFDLLHRWDKMLVIWHRLTRQSGKDGSSRKVWKARKDSIEEASGAGRHQPCKRE
jgi:hypothetical protein